MSAEAKECNKYFHEGPVLTGPVLSFQSRKEKMLSILKVLLYNHSINISNDKSKLFPI